MKQQNLEKEIAELKMKLENKKIYFVKWIDCINNKNFVIINAKNKEDRDKKFRIWCEENPEIAPMNYSSREENIKNCLYLNEIH